MRRVLILCGPPGAGKSTLARSIAKSEGLEVFDRDDPEWRGEQHFREALRRLARMSNARAVVIRAGSTRKARGYAAAMCRATQVQVIETPLEQCKLNIKARRRPGDMRREFAAAAAWWRDYEPGEPVAPPPPKLTGNTVERGYGARHQALRKRWAPKVAAGVVACARCGELIPPGAPWDLGHVDDDRSHYQGPEHRRCNRATAGRQPPKPSGRSREW